MRRWTRLPESLAIALLLTALSFSTVVQAGVNRWTGAGPPADEIWTVVVAPGEESVVYAAGLDGGVLKSVDGGTTWIWTSLTGLEIFNLLVDPADALTVLAATNTESGKVPTEARLGFRIRRQDPMSSRWLAILRIRGSFMPEERTVTFRAQIGAERGVALPKVTFQGSGLTVIRERSTAEVMEADLLDPTTSGELGLSSVERSSMKRSAVLRSRTLIRLQSM
jgi:hypothetical protein